MIGELIPTGVTFGVGRNSINTMFSGTAEFNNLILDSGADFSGGTGGGILYSGGTDLYDIFSGVGGGGTLAQTLALGNSTGAFDIILTSGQVITSSTGDATLNLDEPTATGTWSLVSDNGLYGSGSTWLYGQPGNGTQMAYQKDASESIGFGVFSSGVTTPILFNGKEIAIFDNTGGATKNSGNMDKRAVFVGTRNSTFGTGVTNSVIVGGIGVAALIDDSLYTQNARLAENGGVIYSAGTDLYNIFSTGGGGGSETVHDFGTSGGTVNWDIDNSSNSKITLSSSLTLNISNVNSGDFGTLKITQDGVGSHTITLGTGTHQVVNSGGGSITLTGTIGAVDIITFFYDGTEFLWSVGNDYT